jgi:hypothetical protein
MSSSCFVSLTKSKNNFVRGITRLSPQYLGQCRNLYQKLLEPNMQIPAISLTRLVGCRMIQGHESKSRLVVLLLTEYRQSASTQVVWCSQNPLGNSMWPMGHALVTQSEIGAVHSHSWICWHSAKLNWETKVAFISSVFPQLLIHTSSDVYCK